MDKFAAELIEKSPKVKHCDELGIHCIDYVTELMSDPGAFDSLEKDESDEFDILIGDLFEDYNDGEDDDDLKSEKLKEFINQVKDHL